MAGETIHGFGENGELSRGAEIALEQWDTVATDAAIAKTLADPTSAAHETLVTEVGTVSDPATAGLISSASATQAAGDARWDLSPRNGVVTPATISHAGLSAAFQSATSSQRVHAAGAYTTDQTLYISRACDLSGLTITYTGTGVAVQVGGAGVTFRLAFRLPKVVYGNGGEWDGSSTGMKLVNLNTCDVYVPWVQEFENGLVCTGEGTGFAYNTITLGLLGQNHKNLTLTSDATGWCNQNEFRGGRLSHGSSKGATIDDPTAAQLRLIRFGAGVSGPNNNTFTNTSFEGANWAYYRLQLDAASYNTFINCRYECLSGATEFRVSYKNAAALNRIIGGYDAWKITETFDAPSTPGGVIYDGSGSYASSTLASGGQTFTSGTAATVKAWNAPVSRRLTYNAATGEFTPRQGRWLITAQVAFAPTAAGRRRAFLLCNGAVQRIAEAPGNTIRTTLTLSDVYQFDGASTFRIDAHQDSGSDLGLETSAGYCKVTAQYLPN